MICIPHRGEKNTMRDILGEIRKLIKRKTSKRKLAKEIEVDRSSLHASLKNGANPRLSTLTKVLDHLGYELRISKKRG